MGADFHHGVEVGDVGFAFGGIGVDEGGVDAEGVDGDAGGFVGGGDFAGTGGGHALELVAGAVFPVVGVRLGEEELDAADVLGFQFGGQGLVGLVAEVGGGNADGNFGLFGLGEGEAGGEGGDGGAAGHSGHQCIGICFGTGGGSRVSVMRVNLVTVATTFALPLTPETISHPLHQQ